MKRVRKLFFKVAMGLLPSISLLAAAIPSPFQEGLPEARLVINNRPLAKINGKVISLYDVVKKMDLFVYDYYPEYQLSPPEKYQYYMGKWEDMLEEMIVNELTLLDAAQKEVTASDAEVREEMERRFGPTIMSNLDRVGLQYEEARTIVRDELISTQLIGMRVHSKAFQKVTPQLIKREYQKYLADNPPEDRWKYQVLSFRGEDKERCAQVAEKAHQLLQEKRKMLSEVVEEVEEEGVSIHLSSDYDSSATTISKEHLQALQSLKPDLYSAPLAQVSRTNKTSTVFRIFHLEEHSQAVPPPFEEMHDDLKNQLLFKVVEQEKKTYTNWLKKRFGYDKYDPKFELPEDYLPFALL